VREDGEAPEAVRWPGCVVDHLLHAKHAYKVLERNNVCEYLNR
jgi:hypothetical protein